jgi:2-isopropylmalate synthase
LLRGLLFSEAQEFLKEYTTMRKIFISDITMKQPEGMALSFREKIELAKILDKLGADAIETAPIERTKIDSLLIKSISSAILSAFLYEVTSYT